MAAIIANWSGYCTTPDRQAFRSLRLVIRDQSMTSVMPNHDIIVSALKFRWKLIGANSVYTTYQFVEWFDAILDERSEHLSYRK